jgi:hypothetical protein
MLKSIILYISVIVVLRYVNRKNNNEHNIKENKDFDKVSVVSHLNDLMSGLFGRVWN